MLNIDYDEKTFSVVLSVDPEETKLGWFSSIYRILADSQNSNTTLDSTVIKSRWWSFSGKLAAISSIISINNIRYSISAKAKKQIDKSKERVQSYSEPMQVSGNDLSSTLEGAGFIRRLKPFQERNVKKLVGFNAAATFSVPGAGKTTESLAFFFLKASKDDRLLVVCPKNAYSPWEEQMQQCIGSKYTFVRLTGGRDSIQSLLDCNPKFALITYQQLARVVDLIGSFLSANSVFMFLDESHKIKSGKGKITVDSILSLSHLPRAKLILSGTPMPQSIDDLIPQFNFLYPEKYVDTDSIEDSIRTIYVRTTKAELNLPELKRHQLPVAMAPQQEHVYGLLRSELYRQAEIYLTARNRIQLRQLSRSIMRIIMVVSNPLLIAENLDTAIPADAMTALLSEGEGPKVKYACKRAREYAAMDKKVIIWTTFRKNVELIAEKLQDIGAVYIHGGVDAGDDDNSETREGRIRLFHKDDHCRVLVANPAAASEGISLHTVCKNALYVDRTFNAAHYLQSEDRIHRLGLKASDMPLVEILYSPNTIDEIVNARLIDKVTRMSEVLNDPSLRIDPIEMDTFDIDDTTNEDEPSLDIDDIEALVSKI